MAGLMLETPSRLLRRIDAFDDDDMPSLPPVPDFEDDTGILSSSQISSHSAISREPPHISRSSDVLHASDESLPYQSTPTFSHLQRTVSTVRPPPSARSSARFAQSLASSRSRSTRSAASQSRNGSGKHLRDETFDVSEIKPVPPDASIDCDDDYAGAMSLELANSKASIPVNYQPQAPSLDEEDLDLTEAMEDIGRSRSPFQPEGRSADAPSRKGGKYYDYEVSLKSEAKTPAPKTPRVGLDNSTYRRPLDRTRTPSLTRTSTSLASSLSSDHEDLPRASTSNYIECPRTASPMSADSLPLPRSFLASPNPTPRPASAPPVSYPSDRSIHSDDLHSSDALPPSDVSDSHSSNYRHEVSTIQEVQEEDLVSEEGMQSFTSESRQTVSEADPHEPTHGSEATPRQIYGVDGTGTVPESSPAPSATFTPTPAFQPRPRARFQVPTPTFTPQQPATTRSSDREVTGGEDTINNHMPSREDLDPVTPYSQKRSFLMDVINSTARPRMKFPTPHPNRGKVPETPMHQDSQSSSSPSTAATPAPAPPVARLTNVFAGATPRPRAASNPRPRLSHPLSQGWTATDTESDGGHEFQSGTPEYDPLQDRASFISTASSHDLTVHARANTSFDPAMGLTAQGTGVGRFNAKKLNSYLYGLNKRLEDENKALVDRITELEAKGASTSPATSSNSSIPGRFVNAGRGRARVSVSPGGLGNVEEEEEDGDYLSEKAELEAVIRGLQDELEKSNKEKEEYEAKFNAERALDKQRWRDRMAEVEKGVENIVRDLEQKLDKAEADAKETARRVEAVEAERDVALEKVEIAERALAAEADIGKEMNFVNEELGRLSGELKKTNIRARNLEDDLGERNIKVAQLEAELKDEKDIVEGLDQELATRLDEIENLRKQVEERSKKLKANADELRDTKGYVAELEAEAEVAVERIQAVEAEFESMQARLRETVNEGIHAQERVEELEEEIGRLNELGHQMQEALEVADGKDRSHDEEIAELKGTISALERELEREREKSRSLSRVTAPPGVSSADIEALENELDDAHKEISRLKALMQQSPARRAMETAKDNRIEMLQKERDDLLKRVQVLRDGVNGTPSKAMIDITVASAASPFRRPTVSMLSPKTPGGPLRDASWLNATTNDPTSPFFSEIARLRQDLERANQSIDDKLGQIEEAGIDVINLTRQLEDGRVRIASLEDDVARLSRKDDRRTRRLQKMRCGKCRTKIDFRSIDADESLPDLSTSSLPSNPPTPPTRTSEVLRADLRAANKQLEGLKEQWEREKRQLLGEKAILQDTAHKLNMQIRNAQDEAKWSAESGKAAQKAKVSVQAELDTAKQSIASLESELAAERSKLRSLLTEQDRFERERENVLVKLRRTESDMDDVKESLDRVKHDNHKLEAELRATATVEQKARNLQAKVTENSGAIDRLRQERSMLLNDHKQLQQQYSDVNERMNALRDQLRTAQRSHDDRRQELDLHAHEIEDLRRALTDRENELERAEASKIRVAQEKSEFSQTVRQLEADLSRVRKDAERFGNDLKALRRERDKLEERRKVEVERATKAERGQNQLRSELRLVKEELEDEKGRSRNAVETWKSHICVAGDGGDVLALKNRHKQECKGLIVQIKYLKAKYTRESTMRSDLGFQKHYLLVLLAKFESSETKILAAIARIGYVVGAPSLPPLNSFNRTPKIKFRGAVKSVFFTLRAKRASQEWKQQVQARQAVSEAFQDVRRRRAATNAPSSSEHS